MSRNKFFTAIASTVLALSMITLSGCSAFNADENDDRPETTTKSAPVYGITVLFNRNNEFVKVVKPGSVTTLKVDEHIQTFNPDIPGAARLHFAINLLDDTYHHFKALPANVTVSIGLEDAIDYLESDSGQDIHIGGFYFFDMGESSGLQDSVANIIASDLSEYYDYHQAKKLDYTLTEGPVIQTDPAVAASYLAEKATLEGLGLPLDPLENKYDFICETATYMYDSTVLMKELEKVAADISEASTYDSVTYTFDSQVLVASRKTDLPCKSK